MMQIVNFILPDTLEQKVRDELAKIATDGLQEGDLRKQKLAFGTIYLSPHSNDPRKVAEEIIRVKEIIQAVFEDED